MIQLMKNLNLLQNWYVIDIQTAKSKSIQNISKKFNTKSIKSSLCDYSDAFILVAGDVKVTADNDTQMLHLKIVHHFLYAKQKLMCLLMKQTISILPCLCTILLSIVIIIQTHLEVYCSIKEMKFLLIMLVWLCNNGVFNSQSFK